MAHTISVTAVESKNLDTTCYRGEAPLWQLARVSRADVFDQVTNPNGLQRDLNMSHASQAYAYVAREPNPDLPRAFPEVVLNVRNSRVVEVADLHRDNGVRVVRLTFDLDKIEATETVSVSRVDGNHRLFYSNGDGRKRERLEAVVPFQVHIGLETSQEESLFLDINSEQKGLNTSHLAVLRSKLTPEERELAERPERAFALWLATDKESPWHELVHMGGSRAGTKEIGLYRPTSFITLERGVRSVLRKSQYLPEVTSPREQYEVIKRYWEAVRAVFPEAWDEPKEYLVLRNLGVGAFSLLGATVIDRCLAASGSAEVEQMVPLIERAKRRFRWHREAPDVLGMSGTQSERYVAGEMAQAMTKPEEVEDAA